MRIVVRADTGVRLTAGALAGDAAATGRHLRGRLRTIAGDPVALGFLLAVGFTTNALWGFGLGISPFGSSPVLWWMVVGVFACAPLAALAASGAALVPHAAGPRAVPALPVGPRARALADALAALLPMLLGRMPALLMGPFDLRRGGGGLFFSLDTFVTNTTLGVLLTFPVLVAWTSLPRLDARAFVAGPAVAMAASYGAMHAADATWAMSPLARVAALAPWSLAITAVVLVLAGVEVEIVGRPRSGKPGALARPCPGPLAELRRDRWAGPLARLGPLVVAVLAAPALLQWNVSLLLRPWSGGWLTALQLMMLASLPLFPFGLRVTARSDGAFWAGSFSRAWSVLPVPRERVLRSVYAHAGLTALGAWAGFAAWLVHHAGRRPAADAVWTIALAAVPLLAAVVLCVSAGAVRRGLLAIGCFASLGCLVVTLPLDWSIGLLRTPEHRLRLAQVVSVVLAVVGGLPALTLLRRPRRNRVAPS